MLNVEILLKLTQLLLLVANNVRRSGSYIKLAELCKDIKSKFMITINNDEFIRDIFLGFNIIEQC